MRGATSVDGSTIVRFATTADVLALTFGTLRNEAMFY